MLHLFPNRVHPNTHKHTCTHLRNSNSQPPNSDAITPIPIARWILSLVRALRYLIFPFFSQTLHTTSVCVCVCARSLHCWRREAFCCGGKKARLSPASIFTFIALREEPHLKRKNQTKNTTTTTKSAASSGTRKSLTGFVSWSVPQTSSHEGCTFYEPVRRLVCEKLEKIYRFSGLRLKITVSLWRFESRCWSCSFNFFFQLS